MEAFKNSKSAINVEKLKDFSRLKPFVSFVVIFLEWMVIIGTVLLYVFIDSFWLFPVAVLIIGSRMYAFYSLIHEGCHYLLHKNRIVNDIVVNFFLAWPLFLDVRRMRKIHFQHHKHLQTPDDPEMGHLKYQEFQFPLNRKKLIEICLKDILGYNYVKYKVMSWRNFSFVQNLDIWRVIYYLSVFAAISFTQTWFYYIMFWLLPYMTVYQLLNRIRLYTEHFNLPESETVQTRTLHLPSWMSFFVAPYGLGYHAEHHYYPYVPFYHLRKLHLQLSENVDYCTSVVVEKGYFSLLKTIGRNEAG